MCAKEWFLRITSEYSDDTKFRFMTLDEAINFIRLYQEASVDEDVEYDLFKEC